MHVFENEKSTDIEMLVTVKAYPAISQRHGEAVCVAGVRLDTDTPRWVRLFPVPYRELPPAQRFKKYEVIRLRAWKHPSDRRAESYRPDVSSIERLRFVSPGGYWRERRQIVERLIGPTMCELRAGRKGGALGPSLGLVRAASVQRLQVRSAAEWSPGQRGIVGQGNLLIDKDELEKVPFTFAYEWHCEEPNCTGHAQSIADWEIGEAYRAWRDRYDAIDAIREKWLDSLCAPHRDTHFFVGDQHAFPGSFLVLGVFYPESAPNRHQLTLM